MRGKEAKAFRLYSRIIVEIVSKTPSMLGSDYIRDHIRTVPNWPAPGVMFRDITPLLQDPKTFRVLIDMFVYRYMGQKIDVVAGVDARGFILGAVLAYELNLGFVPIRKKGKLPFQTISEQYELEYGSATVELHEDACKPGDRVVLIDDLVATGGTMIAAAKLLRRLGAEVVECAAIVDLPELGGSKIIKAEGYALHTICAFEGH
jgi:adenine phosphoribosyltransferase